MPVPPHIVTHIVHQSDDALGKADYAAKGLKAISGLQAFRRYDWITDTRALNASGNFRGMVISARWGTVYNVVSKTGERIGTAATVASIAANSIEMAPAFERVYQSNESPFEKSLRYASLAGTVAQKTLAGTVTGGVHLIYLPLIYAADVTAARGPGVLATPAHVSAQVLRNADALIKHAADYVTDPDRQERVITRVVNIFIR